MDFLAFLSDFFRPCHAFEKPGNAPRGQCDGGATCYPAATDAPTRALDDKEQHRNASNCVAAIASGEVDLDLRLQIHRGSVGLHSAAAGPSAQGRPPSFSANIPTTARRRRRRRGAGDVGHLGASFR
ncbi:unnamed protein product, partial [Amoebophrya sp. A120]|eukprot:GSA120T00007645001.1